LNLDSEILTLESSDVEISSEDIPGWLVATEGKITVALDITISPELLQEGIAREVVNRLQNLRKDSGLEVTDRIQVWMQHQDTVSQAIQKNLKYICNEILADSFEIIPTLTDDNAVSVEIDEQTQTLVSIKKLSN
jgi:isoleucyl-tRNA synthetase